MTSRQAISGVLLDAFGTLVRLEPPGPRLRAELKRLAGLDVTEEAAASAFRAEIAYYRDHHLEGSDERSLSELRDRCAGVLASSLELEVEVDRGVLREAMLASIRFTAHPDAAPALRELRTRGLRLIVVSNWDHSLPEVLREAGLLPLIDGVVASATVGAAKPDAEPFSAGLELARSAPAQALHVGDSLEQDVLGARAAGIHAVLLERGGGAGGAAAGVPSIRSLEELSSVI
jgi:putative hydrolase of the HAD superfamily